MKTNIPYIDTPSGITFFLKGKPFRLESSDFRYNKAIELLGMDDADALVELLSNTDAATVALKNVATFIEAQDVGNLKFEITKNSLGATQDVQVYYKLQELPKVIKEKLAGMFMSGIREFDSFTNFLDNILANPRESSREELYTFLSVTEMPITPDGTFIAYKAVGADGYSYTGNKHTRVLNGTTDEAGRIYNAPGEIIEVVVEDVDADRSVGCSYGLHAGSFSYATGFVRGEGRIYAVEVNPRDVVSVPLDCSCQKCRMSKYKVLNEVQNPYNCAEVSVSDTAVESTSEPIQSIEKAVYKTSVDVAPTDPVVVAELHGRIEEYIKTRGGKVTVRQLTKALHRRLPGLHANGCLSLVLHLGFLVDCSNHAGSHIVHA